MIVEDDDQLRDLLKIVFTQEGFTVDIAQDGKVAMDYLTRAKADSRLPKLIILDLNMPVIDGWKLAAWLKTDAVLRKLPVVVTSATQEKGEQAKALGATAYLVKPFTADEIIGIVTLISMLS